MLFRLQVPVQTGDVYLHPHHIVNDYVRTCVKFGDMVEVRAGFRYVRTGFKEDRDIVKQRVVFKEESA